ncbi:MAG: SusC/RagA family TonB-linked outer membrane protein [Gemmatimonadetes bacterium]|nr:SusC/RagA family TonB-linked outer membrane protein [Gemmatimonadota bacterium]
MDSRHVRWSVMVVALLMAGRAPAAAEAQQGSVSGVVVDERTQTPLPNVPVAVEGSRETARTDGVGRFTLTGLTGSQVTLRVAWIGFRPHTVAVAVGARNVRIGLVESAIELDAIVVTGTAGAQQARAVGNAVAMVRAADIALLAPVGAVQELVRGRVAGVDMISGQGLVGAGGNTRIRGTASLTLTNEPLVYVDGVRLDNNTNAGPSIRNGRQMSRLSDLDPEQIERVEIIKGPAAATLYGTEASAGVIQIITKKGVAGKPTLDLSLRQGANWFMNPEGRLNPVYSRNATTGQVTELDLVKQENDAGRPIFSTGRLQGFDAGLRGGTDALRYFLAADYDHDVGVVPYNWLKRINTRANVNITPSEKLDLASSLGFVRSRTRFAQAASAWGVIDQITWGTPTRATGPTRGFLRAPPEVVAEIESFANINRFIGSLQLRYAPWSWLNHRLTAGGDIGDEKNSILFPRHPLGSQYFFGGASLGDLTVERRQSTYTTLDYSSTATFDLTSDLNSATSFGAQYYTKQTEEVTARGREFPSPGVTSIGGAAVTTAGGSFVQNKTLGLFLQQQMSYKNRIFLTAALRGDDNSAFGANFDFVTYPKLSATWVLNEEPFWRWSFVNALKLRGAWGRAGQQPDAFAAVQLYRPVTGPNDQSILTPRAVGNPDLKPEVGEELELGFDASLLRERVALEFSYYRKATKDAIVSRTVAPSLGFPGSQFVNLGEIRNNGLELAVRAQLLDGARLGWELGGSVAHNDNQVVRLGVPPSTGTRQNREGYPVDSYFFFRVLSAGFDANGQVVNAMCEGASGQPEPCSASTPRVYRGRPDPTWQGGINSTVTLFRRLRLYALVDFKTGHVVNNGDVGFSHGSIGNSRAINERTDPVLMALNQFGWLQGTEVMKGGFAKLREISATYILPQWLVGPLRASRGTFSLAGRNLATLWAAQKDAFGTKMHDPEVYIGPTQTMLPLMASVVTTLRLTF